MLLDRWNAALIDAAKFSIISTDPVGTITSFNRAAEKMLGYTAAEVIGKTTPTAIHDPLEVSQRARDLTRELDRTILPGFEVFVVKALLDGSDTQRWTYIRKDGVRFPVRLTVTAIFDENKKHIGYLGIAEDLTEAVRMEMQLMYAAKMSSLGEMAGGIAHEINNPLAIIVGRVSWLRSLLEKNKITNKILNDEFVKIEMTADRISKIIRGLISFSRNSECDTMTPLSVKQIVEETLELCREKFIKNSVELKVDIQEDCKVECRGAQISQVLMNLLNNSFDAVKELSIKWVEVQVRRIGETVQIQVTDSGNGIPEKVQEKLMQPFFTTKEIGAGTGLGLSISKGIVEKHKGTLKYKSNSPHTCFVVTLPSCQKN